MEIPLRQPAFLRITAFFGMTNTVFYWGECRDVVSACMCDRHATSVFPKNNLEVLGNTEHENKKIFAIALGAHSSGRAASRGGCVVHVCLRADVAVMQLAHTISGALFVSTWVP